MTGFLSLALALLHGCALTVGIVLYCRHMKLPWREWPLIVFIVLWSALVAGGQLAGALNALDSLFTYIVSSFIALAIVLLLHRAVYAPPRKTPYGGSVRLPVFAAIGSLEVRKYLWFFLLGTFGLALAMNIITAACVYPGNGDSMVYRLPRAFWYVTHGNLLHPFVSEDKRMTFYPLNGILLYVPLVLYALPGTFHTIPSIFAWLAVTYGTYRFARELRAERLIAAFAAWLVAMTPSILVQATSTNDEIFAAVALLLGIFFFWRWLVSGAEHYLYLAGLGAGLSVGTKLHIVFLLPIVFAALAWFALFLHRRHTSWHAWLPDVRIRTIFVSLFAAAFMGVMFLILNYISSGRFYFFDDFAHEVFNMSASIHGALQNLLIYTAQMMIAPIADLNFWSGAAERVAINQGLNEQVSPLIASFIDKNVSHFHLHYRFAGIIIPTSPYLVEFSLWPGFVWLLWILQFAFLYRQKFSLRPLFILLAATPLAWLFIWSFTTLYMEGIPVYFSFYLICAAPAAVFCFAAAKEVFWSRLRWIILGVVAITSVVINLNVYLNSTFRGMEEVMNAPSLPVDWLQYEKPAIEELRRADKIQIIPMHSMVYYFSFMHWNTHAKYYGPYEQGLLATNGFLQIAPIPGEFKYGFIPIKVPNKATPGMTHLGNIRGVDREAIFATGNNVDLRWPEFSGYVIMNVAVKPDGSQYKIVMSKGVAGVQPADRLQFKYVLKTENGGLVYERTWDGDPSFSVDVPNDPQIFPYILTVTVRSTLNGTESAPIAYPLERLGSWRIQDDPDAAKKDEIYSRY